MVLGFLIARETTCPTTVPVDEAVWIDLIGRPEFPFVPAQFVVVLSSNGLNRTSGFVFVGLRVVATVVFFRLMDFNSAVFTSLFSGVVDHDSPPAFPQKIEPRPVLGKISTKKKHWQSIRFWPKCQDSMGFSLTFSLETVTFRASIVCFDMEN